MKKISETAHFGLKVLIYSLVPVVFLLVVTANSMIFFGIRSFVVSTGSMEPEIPVGSIIFSIPQKTYSLGEVVLFKDEQSRTVAHRVSQSFIKHGDVLFQTKGDANNTPETKLVPGTKILGREFFVIPVVGRIANIVKTVPGFLIFLGLPTLVFIGFELNNIKNEIENDTEKRIKEKMNLSF